MCPRDDAIDARPDRSTLRVAVFAGMADRLATRHLDIPWHGGTVADLRRHVGERHPEVGDLLARSAFALGDRYVGDAQPIVAGDDVAIIPPVSGG